MARQVGIAPTSRLFQSRANLPQLLAEEFGARGRGFADIFLVRSEALSILSYASKSGSQEM